MQNDHDRLMALGIQVIQHDRQLAEQEAAIVEMKHNQVQEAFLCPFYPGKSGDGGDMILNRLQSLEDAIRERQQHVEDTINHVKWYLAGSVGVLVALNGVILSALGIWKLWPG